MRSVAVFAALSIAGIATLGGGSTHDARADSGDSFERRPLARPAASVVGDRWVLEQVKTAGGSLRAPAGVAPYLQIDEAGALTGSTGCNVFGGFAEVGEGVITFERLVTTTKACVGALGRFDGAVQGVLRGHTTTKLTGNTLTITNDLGESLLLTTAGADSSSAYHYTHNVSYSEAPAAVGFNVWDVGPSDVESLPSGHLGLIWYGGGDYGTCTPSESTEDFKAHVDALADSDKVFGWYLWDEPNLAECGADLVALLRERAEYIREATGGAQKSFVVAGGGDGEPVPPELAPAESGIDLLGIDPYPCRSGEECELGLIDKAVNESTANGTPQENLVPVYQAFGQDCTSGDQKWRMPTAEETVAMFERWDQLLPDPVFDLTYSWGRQDQYACPALVDESSVQQVYQNRFAQPGGGSQGAAP